MHSFVSAALQISLKVVRKKVSREYVYGYCMQRCVSNKDAHSSTHTHLSRSAVHVWCLPLLLPVIILHATFQTSLLLTQEFKFQLQYNSWSGNPQESPVSPSYTQPSFYINVDNPNTNINDDLYACTRRNLTTFPSPKSKKYFKGSKTTNSCRTEEYIEHFNYSEYVLKQ